jgi:hypothetical protein
VAKQFAIKTSLLQTITDQGLADAGADPQSA